MSRYCQICKRVFLVAVCAVATFCVYAVGKARVDTSRVVTINTWTEVNVKKHLATSAFPVKMEVKGVRLKVQSKYQQVLPIYTQSGVLYMNVHLTRGTNWLSGLPRGQYRINNRTVVIG